MRGVARADGVARTNGVARTDGGALDDGRAVCEPVGRRQLDAQVVRFRVRVGTGAPRRGTRRGRGRAIGRWFALRHHASYYDRLRYSRSS